MENAVCAALRNVNSYCKQLQACCFYFLDYLLYYTIVERTRNKKLSLHTISFVVERRRRKQGLVFVASSLVSLLVHLEEIMFTVGTYFFVLWTNIQQHNPFAVLSATSCKIHFHSKPLTLYSQFYL